MERAGSLQVGQFTSLAGTPAAVHPAGTGRSTTEPDADLGIVADVDVPQHLGPRADQDAAADLRMPVAALGARAAEGDPVQHGDLVAHNRGLPDDDAGARGR